MGDMIERSKAIGALKDMYQAAEKWGREAADDVIKARAESCMASIVEMKLRIENLPPAQPDNKINLCDSCKHTFPACPARSTDVIWGNGTWNDNICVCSKYEPSSQLHGTCKTCIMGSICKFRAGLGDNGYCSQWKAEESEQDG